MQLGARAIHHQRADGVHHAISKNHIPVQRIVGGTTAEQVAEIQAQPSGEGVEVQQAKDTQCVCAGFTALQCTIFSLQLKLPGAATQGEKDRRARPAQVRLHGETAARQCGRITPGFQYIAHVTRQHLPFEMAAWAGFAPVHFATELQTPQIHIEVVDLRPRRIWSESHIHRTHRFSGPIQLIDMYIHGRQRAGFEGAQAVFRQ